MAAQRRAAAEVWIIRPRTRTMDVHRHGHHMSTHRGADIITTPVLPGFRLALSDIFT